MNARPTSPPRCARSLAALLSGSLTLNLVAATLAEDPAPSVDPVAVQKDVVIRKVEPGESAVPKEVTWLGLSADEASDALASQLGLDPGVGLLVTFVTADSPAAKAGLRKHDVLIELERQSLVHPSQLRKLVRAREEGDKVEIVFYRGGKREKTSATLGKTPAGFAGLGEDFRWEGDLEKLKQQLRDLRIGENVREGMKELRRSLEDLRDDRHEVRVEIRKGMAEAEDGIREALRQLTNLPAALEPAADVLKELARSGVQLDKDARVVVRSTGQSTRSLVQTDDSGTIVIVGNPKRRLTAHDADGKLLFDGEIETAEQQAGVPRDLWKKVEPLLDKLNAEAE